MAKINLKLIIPYLASLFLFTTHPALAYNHLLYNANNQTSLNWQWLNLKYREHNNQNQFLDGVTGTLPGLNLTIDKTIENIYLEGVLAGSFKNNLTYTGGIAGFNELHTSSKNAIYQGSIKAGYILQPNDRTNLIPYIEFGYRHWNREIPPVNFFFDISNDGYIEHYTNYFYDVGVKYQYAYTKPLVLSAFAAMGSTVNAQLKAHLPIINGIDVNHKLPNKLLGLAELTADYLILYNLHLLAGIHYEHFAFGKSNTSMHSYEPDSTTRNLTYTIGIGFNF